MRPGYDCTETSRGWAFTSPMLQDDGDSIMAECPVGYLLRESPHTYAILDYLSLGEQLSPFELGKMPMYFAHMLRVYQNEHARIYEIQRKQREAKSHADIATRAISNGR